MTYYIKQLTTADYASVKDIFCLTFLQESIPVSYLGYRWRNRNHETSFGIYSRANDLVGFALVSDGRHTQVQQLKKDKSTTSDLMPSRYLSFMALHPSYRGGNLGSHLLKALLTKTVADNKSMCLFPLDSARLKAWYTNNGFNTGPSEYYNFHCHATRSQSKHLQRLH
jgi:GNAT superfamily N-acetyltransferase